VFDSGVGGLSVLEEIRRHMPAENLLYVGDSGYAPYGDRPPELIEARSVAIVRFLIERHAKAIVVACNTATSVAIETLRTRFDVPIVGMEPAIKPAAARTRTGVIGVLATSQTLASSKFSRLVDGYRREVEILTQPCPGLVEQVEQGALSDPATRSLVAGYVTPLVERGADILVLGCTHYHFLRPTIEDVAGDGVSIVDPGPAIARELHRRLEQGGLVSSSEKAGSVRFWTSGEVSRMQPTMTRLWATGGRKFRS